MINSTRILVPSSASPNASIAPNHNEDSTPAPKLAERHIPVLDGLRGLAILLVMMHHFVFGIWHSNPLAGVFFRIAASGWCGVDLFFVLSGFLITGILYDAKGGHAYFRNFYMRRTLRIFPLYYGVLFITFIFPLLIWRSQGTSVEQLWLWFYASNIYSFFHSGQWLDAPNHFNFSFTNFWSLAVEEHFYLAWPLLIWLLSRRRALTVCVALILIAPALRLFLVLAYPTTIGGGLSLPYLFTPCRMDALAIGAFIALVARGPLGLSKLRLPAVCLFLALTPLIIAGMTWNHLDRESPLVATLGYTLLPLFFASVLILLVLASPRTIPARIFSGKTLSFFGRYSYGIYVFHGIFVEYLNSGPFSVQALAAQNGHYFLNVLLHLFIASTLTVGLAWLSWHCYEKHFLKLKRYFKYESAVPAKSPSVGLNAPRSSSSSAPFPKPDLSLAICTYNAEKRIAMVLESLAREQTGNVNWELLVIDNASSDNTSAIARDLSAKFNLPLRLIHEPEAGLANARRRATLEAHSDLLSFVDDDTSLDSDWVTSCVAFAVDHPNAGIFGAKVDPLFEDITKKPANFYERFPGIVSLYNHGDQPFRLLFPKAPTPVGAGMCGRTALFRLVFDQFRTLNVGRDQNTLAGGEDIEAMFIADRLGWEVWYAPSLHLHHYVSNARMTDAYYDRWVIQTASCNAWLLVLNGNQPRASSAYYRRQYWSYQARTLKYALLGLLPSRLHPKLARAKFWRTFYHSIGLGYYNLSQNPAAINRVFQLIEQHKRPTASLSQPVVFTPSQQQAISATL